MVYTYQKVSMGKMNMMKWIWGKNYQNSFTNAFLKNKIRIQEMILTIIWLLNKTDFSNKSL